MKQIINPAEPRELRVEFMEALINEMENDSKLIMLEADLGGASKSQMVKKKYPEQYINVGIAEANMVGIAAGLSLRGYQPFIHTFAPFVARRAADQIYMSGVFSQNNMVIYASDPGICAAKNGGTHTTFEDIAYMRALPNVNIYYPADQFQMKWLVKSLVGKKGIHYIRASRKGVPIVYTEEHSFELGKGNLLQEGKDVLMVTAGDLITEALNAAKELEKQNYSVSVIDMFQIKPLDEELLLQQIRGKKLIITLDNHSVYGGLGSAVAEVVAENGIGIPVHRMGIRDEYAEVGDMDYLIDRFGLSSPSIVAAALERLQD